MQIAESIAIIYNSFDDELEVFEAFLNFGIETLSILYVKKHARGE